MSGPLRKQDDNNSGFSSEEAEAVRAQVDNILADPLFRDTTRMKRFLRYVTEETLAGRGARLKGYTIGLEVFDKSSDFDPQNDTIVRVQAGQLRRRLDLYYARAGEDARIRLTIPKGRYAPRFEVRVDDSHLLEGANSADVSSDVGLDFPGVAVLTLESLNETDNPPFFAEGLTAEIVSVLVQFRHVRVLTLRSTEKDFDPASIRKLIGEDYDIQFVLSGSVRRSGDIFRVSVNLSDAETGRIIYSENFDRAYTPDTLFELQESIASNVAATIAAPFGQINRHNRRLQSGRRTSMSAYEAVLRFYAMGFDPTQSEASELLSDLELITRDNADFSTGFAIRAFLHTFLCTQRVPPSNPQVNLEEARRLSEKAVRIDPQNSMAVFAQFQAAYHSGNVDEAEDLARRAISLNPNDYTMRAYLAVTRAWAGDIETARVHDRSARDLVANPPDWFISTQAAIHFQTKDYEGVVALVQEANRGLTLNFPVLHVLALSHLGQEKEAAKAYLRLASGDPNYAVNVLKTLSYWHLSDAMKQQIISGFGKMGVETGRFPKG